MGTQAPNTHFHGALLPFSPIPQNNPTRTSPRAHKNNPTIPQAHSPTSPQKKPTSPQNKSSPAPQELDLQERGPGMLPHPWYGPAPQELDLQRGRWPLSMRTNCMILPLSSGSYAFTRLPFFCVISTIKSSHGFLNGVQLFDFYA